MTATSPTHPDAHHMNAAAWLTWAIPGVVWGTSFFFIAECLDAFPAPLITPLRVLLGFATLALVPVPQGDRSQAPPGHSTKLRASSDSSM